MKGYSGGRGGWKCEQFVFINGNFLAKRQKYEKESDVAKMAK